MGTDVKTFPLQACEGHCEDNNDCDWGLNCMQRFGTEDVPGCGGEGNPSMFISYTSYVLPPTKKYRAKQSYANTISFPFLSNRNELLLQAPAR